MRSITKKEPKGIFISDKNTAIVLKIGDRYFAKKGKKKVLIAWCLAGAKTYMPMFRDYEIEKDEAMLKAKGYKPKRVYITDRDNLEAKEVFHHRNLKQFRFFYGTSGSGKTMEVRKISRQYKTPYFVSMLGNWDIKCSQQITPVDLLIFDDLKLSDRQIQEIIEVVLFSDIFRGKRPKVIFISQSKPTYQPHPNFDNKFEFIEFKHDPNYSDLPF